MNKKERILITGITGFAGSHMVDFLIENTNANIYGLKRPNSQMKNIHHVAHDIELINGDLNDQTSLIRIIKKIKPDKIYHFGALSWVTPSWEMPDIYMKTNAIGTIYLFEACLQAGIMPRILISCTPEEYGDVPKDLIPINENTRIHPINPYAASKAAQDMVCLTYHASYNLPIIRTRAFNHEGPRRDILGANASFAYQIALIERGKKDYIEVGNLEATRNFTDVKDTVEAYYLALEKGDPGELYLIGSDQIYTMKECLDTLISLSDNPEKIKYKVNKSRVRPTELRTFIGDYQKFYDKTGWKPKIPFIKTMQSVLDYWREFIDKGYY